MKREVVLAVSLLLVVGRPVPLASGAGGFDATYAGQSAFLTLAPGTTGAFTVFFLNSGTASWVKGTPTQVDLAACLADKVTCNAQDATDAPFDPGTWLSAGRYSTTASASVAPQSLATFTYSVKPPFGTIQGIYRFNGDLVLASTGERIRPQGYYQDALVTAPAARIEVTPATAAEEIDVGSTVTITYRSATGAPQANVPIDVFVVRDTNPFTSTGQCDRVFGALPSSTGQRACEIDSADPITDSSGKIQFWWSGNFEETHRVIAWTGALGSAYAAAATQGSATMAWHGKIARLKIGPDLKTNRFLAKHTASTQLERADGTPLGVAGRSIGWQVVRGAADAGATCGQGTVSDVGSSLTDAAGKATFTYTGPLDPSSVAGSTTTDCVFAFHDRNLNGLYDGNELTDAVTVTWSDAAAGTGKAVGLEPAVQAGASGGSHSVSASLRDVFADPVIGAIIRFQITRVRSDDFVRQIQGIVLTGAGTTGLGGVASFSYAGPPYGAIDTIDACHDANGDGDCTDPGEVSFGSVGDTTMYWADQAVTSTSQSYIGTTLFCDKAQHIVYVYVLSGPQTGNRRFAHAGYVHYLNGSVSDEIDGPSRTVDAWETQCAPDDRLVIRHEVAGGLENESKSP